MTVSPSCSSRCGRASSAGVRRAGSVIGRRAALRRGGALARARRRGPLDARVARRAGGPQPPYSAGPLTAIGPAPPTPAAAGAVRRRRRPLHVPPDDAPAEQWSFAPAPSIEYDSGPARPPTFRSTAVGVNPAFDDLDDDGTGAARFVPPPPVSSAPGVRDDGPRRPVGAAAELSAVARLSDAAGVVGAESRRSLRHVRRGVGGAGCAAPRRAPGGPWLGVGAARRTGDPRRRRPHSTRRSSSPDGGRRGC